MITSIHSLIYSDDAQATLAFASRPRTHRAGHVASLPASSILRDPR